MKEKEIIRFDLSTHIQRPLAQVFTFVATPDNDFQWQYGTLASTQISHGETRLGTLFRAVGVVMGRRIETQYEVTVFEPNQRYGFKSISGPLDCSRLYSFEMSASGTRLNLSTEADPGDLFNPNDITALRRFKKQYKENLAMLKSVLEAQRIPGR